MSRSLRTFSLLARPVVAHRPAPLIRRKYSILRENGPVTIQPVRFRRAPFSFRRSVLFAVRFLTACYVLHRIADYLVPLEEVEVEETQIPEQHPTLEQKGGVGDGSEEGSTNEEEEYLIEVPEDLPEDAIFIPLWWGTKRPRTYYKGSDPEWQAYAKFSRDEKLQASLKKVVRKFIANELLRNKGLADLYGKSFHFERQWLNFDYPSGPPAQYDRIGLEFATDYIAVTKRPQSEEHYKKVRAILWPESIAKSFWASIRIYGGLQYARAKNFLTAKGDGAGFHGDAISQTPVSFPRMPQQPDKQTPPIKADLSGGKSATDTKDRNSPPGSSKGHTSASQQSGSSADTPRILSTLPALKKPSGDLGSSVDAFKRRLLQTWKRPPVLERGEVLLSGRVEVLGDKASFEVVLLSTYHPSTRRFRIHDMGFQNIRPRKLVPRGGS